MIRNLIAALPTFALFACGGSGSENTPIGQVPLLNQSQIIDQGYALINEFGSQAPTTNMPTADTATYVGVGAGAAGIASSDPSVILANATSVYQIAGQVNFGNSTFQSEAFNFKSSTPGYTIVGDLQASGTVSGNSFSGTFGGVLTESYSGISVPVTYSGTLNGNFVGDSAAAMMGTSTGTGSATGYPTISVSGFWGAAKQ